MNKKTKFKSIYDKLKNNSEDLKISELITLANIIRYFSITNLAKTEEEKWLFMFLKHMINAIEDEIDFKTNQGHIIEDVFESYYFFNNMNDIRDAFLHFEKDIMKIRKDE